MSVDRRLAVANAMADMITQNWYDPLMPSFSCSEANLIAEFLNAFRGSAAADTFLAGHAFTDEEGDEHYEETK